MKSRQTKTKKLGILIEGKVNNATAIQCRIIKQPKLNKLSFKNI